VVEIKHRSRPGCSPKAIDGWYTAQKILVSRFVSGESIIPHQFRYCNRESPEERVDEEKPSESGMDKWGELRSACY
jgi:hypothetical protein